MRQWYGACLGAYRTRGAAWEKIRGGSAEVVEFCDGGRGSRGCLRFSVWSGSLFRGGYFVRALAGNMREEFCMPLDVLSCDAGLILLGCKGGWDSDGGDWV